MWKASHAGQWYPIGQSLEKMFITSFAAAKVEKIQKNRVKAVIAPHAGYTYCVATAAHSFSSIDTSLFDKVVVLGPSHRLFLKECSIVDAKVCETPFGEISIDESAKDLISKYPKLFKSLDIPRSEAEHSLELMLPYIKYIFKSKPITILPIMVGNLNLRQVSDTAEALKPIINDPKTLVVISSDFVHWGHRFGYSYLPEGSGPIHERIAQIDHGAMDQISTTDAIKFWNYVETTEATICGRIPITIAMVALDGKCSVEWLHYSQSSQVTSPNDTSVSYSSGVFLTKEEPV